MLLGLGKTLTFGQKKIYPYATGGDYVYLYEDTETGKTYRVHQFLSTGTSTLEVEVGGQMECLVVGGGGGGAYGRGAGGGGAGGVLVLDGVSSLNLARGSYTITVGNGGAATTTYNGVGNNGQDSSITGNGISKTAIGGGGGGAGSSNGKTGGSGGGGRGTSDTLTPGDRTLGGSGESGPPVQGNAGGDGSEGTASYDSSGGGGGGAGASGQGGESISPGRGGNGGDGIEWPLGSGTYYGGGGGGGTDYSVTAYPGGIGGLGGGGNGANRDNTNTTYPLSAGVANTGGGGGGATRSGSSAAGGSGIVIVRYVVAEKTLWTPAELENLSFWFDVSQETPQSDDTEMTSLTDFSGNGRNLTAYGTTKPKYRTNLLNGLPGVKFTGSGLFWTQNWQSGDWPLLYDPLTLATISREAANSQTFAFETPGGATISRFGVFGTFFQYWNAWATYRYAFALAGGITPVQSYTNTPSLGSDSIKVSTKNSSGTTTMRGNGSDCTPGLYYAHANGGGTVSDLHVNVSSTTRYRGMSIGGTINNPQTPTFYFTPDSTYFYEVVHYNEVLSSENQKKLEGYLAHKWGKTSSLPSGHPYKYEPPYKVDPEEIVTDGLVLNLDAGDYASYPRSGTTWYDISGNGNHATLNGTYTFDVDEGSIEFSNSSTTKDSNVSYIKAPSISNMRTFSFWFYRNAIGGTTWRYFLDGRPTDGSWIASGSTGSFWTNSTLYLNGTEQTFSWANIEPSSLDEWRNVTIISPSSLSATLYIFARFSGNEAFPGTIGNIQIYNRALSSTEIQQNFNALRGRYGV